MSLGELDASRTVVLSCDMQERFAPSIAAFDAIAENAARVIAVANILEMPIVVTEQYPKVILATDKFVQIRMIVIENI